MCCVYEGGVSHSLSLVMLYRVVVLLVCFVCVLVSVGFVFVSLDGFYLVKWCSVVFGGWSCCDFVVFAVHVWSNTW